MNKVGSILVAALVAGVAAGSAGATVTLSVASGTGGTGANVTTFDNSSSLGNYTYTTSQIGGTTSSPTFTTTYTGAPSASTGGTGAAIVSGSSANNYSAPANDSTPYLAVYGGYAEALTLANGATSNNSLTFYWGTPGSTDAVYFYNGSTLVDSYTGQQLNTAGYSATTSNLVTLTTTQAFNTVVFAAGQNSFELDNIQFGNAASVPEPASWAMMIGGFGLVGGVMRRKRLMTVTA